MSLPTLVNKLLTSANSEWQIDMCEPNQEAFFELARLAFLAEELEEAEEPQRKKRLWVKKWVGRRDVEVPLFQEIRTEPSSWSISVSILKILTNYWQGKLN